MRSADFYALLSRAYPGGVTRDEMRWEISLTEAYGMILASGILHGGAFVWPDPRLSRSGRQMLKLRDKLERWKTEGFASMIDL